MKLDIITAVVALVILIGLFSCQRDNNQKTATGGGRKQNSKANISLLPGEFKEYEILNSNFKSADFEAILLAKSDNYGATAPLQMFYTVNDQVVLSIERDEKEGESGYHYYKLDKNGNTVDSLYVPFKGGGRTGFVGAYVVSFSYEEDYYYTTWPLNGSHERKKMSILNKDLNWPEEQVAKVYADVVGHAKHVFYNEIWNLRGHQLDQPFYQVFFFKDGKWQVLYRQLNTKQRITDLDQLYKLRNDFYKASNDENPRYVPNFELRHFQKEELISYEHSIGGGAPSFSKKDWVGTGYFNIAIKNKVLKFKLPNMIVEQGETADQETRYYTSHGSGESVSPLNLNFYTDPRLGYAVYSNSAYRLYLIRPI